MKTIKKQILKMPLLGVLAILSMMTAGGAADLAGHWRFDQSGGLFPNLEGDSAQAKVQPAENRDAMPVVPDEIGEVKEVVEFDGSGNSWISAPVKMGGEDFTIELWLKANEGKQRAVLLGNSSGIVLSVSPNGELVFLLASGAGGKWSGVNIPNAVSMDKWIHVMARFVDCTQQLFVDDGTNVLSSRSVKLDNPKQFIWSQTVLGINNFDRTLPFSGRMAALKIYCGSLSEESFKQSKP